MRSGTDDLLDVLQGGSFTRELQVDVYQGATRALEGVGCDRWDLRWDREGELKSAGTLRIVESTDDGTSLAPKKITDPLAPYGQEVGIRMLVSAGDFQESVQVGFYRIAATPEARDEYADFRDGQIVSSSTISLSIEDRLGKVRRRGFRSEENPASTSAWDELARISGMQVARNVPDAVLPDDLVYQAVKGGRLNAVKTIATALGGTEYTTPDGQLAVWPSTPDDPVATLRLGDDGVILGDTQGMDSTEVYNVVVGVYEDADRNPIYKVAVAGEGAFVDLADLHPNLIGENTYYQRNSTVKTEADAEADVAATLYNVARQARRITVSCILNPLLEVGDVVNVQRRDGSVILGQLVKGSYGNAGPMSVDVDVLGEVDGA
jgi:hypothetical protein